MYTIYDAHPFTTWLLIASTMFAPLYLFAVYALSGASTRKGLQIAAVFLVWGAAAAAACLLRVTSALGPFGPLLIPLSWLCPTLALVLLRGWFLSQPLSQRLLVGVQVIRVIGGVFLIEMTRGNIPGVFAWPAGLGDLLTGALALVVLLRCPRGQEPSRRAVLLVLIIGCLDFTSALFFGFTSNEGPARLFARGLDNKLVQFPTGLIPLFLVPCAIFFHALSWLQLRVSSGRPTRSRSARALF